MPHRRKRLDGTPAHTVPTVRAPHRGSPTVSTPAPTTGGFHQCARVERHRAFPCHTSGVGRRPQLGRGAGLSRAAVHAASGQCELEGVVPEGADVPAAHGDPRAERLGRRHRRRSAPARLRPAPSWTPQWPRLDAPAARRRLCGALDGTPAVRAGLSAAGGDAIGRAWRVLVCRGLGEVVA